jgi:hypothetical protein
LEIAAGTVHQLEKKMNATSQQCLHNTPFLSEEQVFTTRKKGSFAPIVGLASSRGSRSGPVIFKNKGEKSKPQENKAKKSLNICLSRFEEYEFKVKDHRMLINSYYLR